MNQPATGKGSVRRIVKTVTGKKPKVSYSNVNSPSVETIQITENTPGSTPVAIVCKKCKVNKCLPSRQRVSDYVCSICYHARPMMRIATRRYKKSEKGKMANKRYKTKAVDHINQVRRWRRSPMHSFSKIIGLHAFRILTR